jgi:hypothetical protein
MLAFLDAGFRRLVEAQIGLDRGNEEERVQEHLDALSFALTCIETELHGGHSMGIA